MSTTTTEPTATNGTNGPEQPNFVKRVASIPVVADTLNTAYTTIQANSYSAAVYGRAEGAVHYLYETSKPYHDKLSGPVSRVDGLANKGLDYVQSKAPYVFEAKTDELISKARQPADQAYALSKAYADAATARLAPITEQFHARLSQSAASLHALQEKLAQAVRDPKSVGESAKGLSDQVLSEVEKLQGYVSEKRKELPAQAQAAVGPFVEKLQQSFADIKTEITKADTSLATRASNVLNYSRNQATPLLNEAVEALKQLIGKAQAKTNGATATAPEDKENDRANNKAGGVEGAKQ